MRTYVARGPPYRHECHNRLKQVIARLCLLYAEPLRIEVFRFATRTRTNCPQRTCARHHGGITCCGLSSYSKSMASNEEHLPGITAAQFQSFARRMPSYYASVVIMMLAVTLVFHSLAPAWLSCGIPTAIAVLGIWRGWWWALHQHDQVSDLQAGRYIYKATVVLVVAALVAIAMDIRLYSYGDVYARFFLLIQILSSATCGFYCLMHLRKAALLVFAALMLPFGGMALALGHLGTSVAGMTALFTAGVMILAMRGYERDFVSLIQAKAETVQLSKDNLRLAHIDMLTGLPNRRYFFNQVEACMGLRRDEPALPTVGIIDLDGFKPVNDTYGHRIGDRVLEVIASRLSELEGELRHLCRLGGDEFVFMTAITEPARLQALGGTIADAVSQSIQLEERSICVGCSVGFAVQASHARTDGFELFEQADYALYHAKRSGRARTVLFSGEHETLIRDQGLMEQTLRNAELHSEFYLVYQPIIDLRTHEVAAFECLARWNSPVLGEVSPGTFIPIAEHAGLIGELTLVLMEKALAVASSWPEHIHLSFNVSPHEMASLEQTRRIVSLIQNSGITPSRVGIELTETALLNNFAEVSKHMGLIRNTGAEIYLDDFGTGHSSLSYIHALPLDKVKVDRSFIKSIESNRASGSVVRSVITLCRDLQIACVIEGVETASQLALLRDLGAELIQGYFFSKPLPEHMVGNYIASMLPHTASSMVGRLPLADVPALALRAAGGL